MNADPAGDTIEITSVNVGVPELLHDDEAGGRVFSAIAKAALPEGRRLWLSLGNLAGDAQADLTVHGGPDKAVYAYPSEHLASWASELGEALGVAPFGENLSSRGVVEGDVCIGDIWQWDDAVLQVCQPRWPCFKLALHRKRGDIQARMRATGRTGWYLRVLQPGEVVVGSRIRRVTRDSAGLTVFDAHLAMRDRHLDNRELVHELANHHALAAEWRLPLMERLE